MGACAPNQVMTYANVASSVVQNQSFVRPPSSTAIQGPQISTALPGRYASTAPRYMSQNTGNQNKITGRLLLQLLRRILLALLVVLFLLRGLIQR